MKDSVKDEEDGTKDARKGADTTVPNPPSFYYDDMEKWNKKFANHIKDRDNFKKQF